MKKKFEILLIEGKKCNVDCILNLMDSQNGYLSFQITHVDLLTSAVEFVDKNNADLIVLIIDHKKNDKLDDVRNIIKEIPEIPLVVLVSGDDIETGKTSQNIGAQDYIIQETITFDLLSMAFFCSIERHAVKESFKKKEQQYIQSSIDTLTASIAIINSHGDILFTNRTWSESVNSGVLGCKEISITTNYLKECDHISGSDTKTAAAIAAGIRAVIKGKNTFFQVEYAGQTTPFERWFSCQVAPFSNNPQRFIITHEEITNRKLTEGSLKIDKNWLQVLTDASPNCIYVTDKKGKYIFVNQALADLYGLDKSQIIGRVNSELTCDYLKKNKTNSESSADASGTRTHSITPYRINSSYILPNGSVRWYGTISKSIQFPTEPDCTLHIATDMTELFNTQDELRNSEIRLRTILDAQSSKVVLLDSQRQVLWPNAKACETSGLSRQDLIGRKCYNVWNNKIVECELCPVEEALKKGKSSSIQQTTSDGHIWQIYGYPVRDEMGRVVGAVEVIDDITKQISLEGQLRQAQKMESLGTLAGGIAHDFNNILSGILGYAELAQEKANGSDTLTDYLNEIFGAGLRAAELTRQILTFSRHTNAELFPLKIKPVVQEAIKFLRPTLPTSIEFNIHIDGDFDKILADPTQIHQIIINLCTNASHAMEPYGGVLGVELTQVEIAPDNKTKLQPLKLGKYLKLAISDTGCGMSPDIISSIFDPYFTTKDLGVGTGLGLSVVHGIVQEYGGDILVDSTPGKGTLFTLFFPTVEKTTADNDQQKSESLPTGNEHILVVDDEPIILKLCSRILKKQGYRVTAENDSLKALERFKETPDSFDLVFTDVTMPKMTGDILAQEILTIRPKTPVILCTGYSLVVTEESIKQMGIRALLTKPIVKQRMISEVRGALDNEIA